MLSLQGYLDLLNDGTYKSPVLIERWRKIYYGLSLHIDGVRPAYQDLRYPAKPWIYPASFAGAYYQEIFDVELLNRHPREKEEQRQLRLSQYRPFQKDPFLRVIQSIVGAIFQDSNYSIQIDNKDDNDYIWGENFEGKSLPDYFASKAKNIFEDPNGVFIIVPAEPYYATTTSLIQPKIFFIPSKDIIYIANDEIVFNILDYTWAVNNIGYFRFKKDIDIDKYIHVDEKHGGYYAHLTGSVPIMVAGGQWNTQGYFDSWLDAAKAWADEFVTNKSAEQMVNKDSSHPYKQFASDVCPSCEGRKQIQYCTYHKCPTDNGNCNCTASDADRNYALRYCENCGGTGTVSRNPGDHMEVPMDQMDKDAIKIHNPDMTVNEFHKKNNEDIFLALMRSLHLNYIDEAQSGTAKDKDMETRYQFYMAISNDWFERLIRGVIKQILSLRNVTTNNGITIPSPAEYIIMKPTQFAIKTADQILQELDTATKAKVPYYIRAKQTEDYVDRYYGGDEVMKRKTSIINKLDKYSVATNDEIAVSVLNGFGTQRQAQYHEALPLIIDEIIDNVGKEDFVNMPFERIKKMANGLFDAQYPKIPMISSQITEERVNV